MVGERKVRREVTVGDVLVCSCRASPALDAVGPSWAEAQTVQTLESLFAEICQDGSRVVSLEEVQETSSG